MSRRRSRRSSKEYPLPEISLTPLIDTTLVLLIIFMVAMPVMKNAVKVDLPYGITQEGKGAQQEIVVAVTRNEEIYVNNVRTSLRDMQKAVRQQVAASVTPQELKDRNKRH